MDSILDRFADNLTEVTYITNPAVARDDEIKKLINIQLEISKYVMIGIPTKYFNENEKLYGNERFMSISEWKKILNTQNVNIVEGFFMNNQNLIKRILNYKKWFKIPPIYVFVIKKGE